MTPRTKKLILVLCFMPALLIYIGAVLWISDRLPQHWLVLLAYYLVVGTVWAFPLKPVFGWANSPPK